MASAGEAQPASAAGSDHAAAPAAPAAATNAPAGRSGGADDQVANRSKKRESRKRGGKGATLQQEVTVGEQQQDLVRLVRSERRTDNFEDSSVVQLSSAAGKAAQLQLSQDRLSVTGHKGFRTVRATHGVYQGTWYCEVQVKHLGATGHARLGWCTKKAELQAPVGFDTHGFAYRDLEGSKVHNGCREPYGKPFKQGDVVGLLIHMPEGGRPIEPQERKVFRYKGSVWYEEEQEPKPKPLPGAALHFFLNGEHQGAAYTDILEGTYYPAVSLFTLPEQKEGATLQLNFGPDWTFPPRLPADLPSVSPMSSVAGLQQAAAAGGDASAGAGAGGAAVGAGAAAAGTPTGGGAAGVPSGGGQEKSTAGGPTPMES